jgi:hypothetical protein
MESKVRVNLGLIIKGNLKDLNLILSDIANDKRVDVVFEKFSFDRLWIKEGGSSNETE